MPNTRAKSAIRTNTRQRAGNALSGSVAAPTGIPARERKHCIECGAFLTVHPTHNDSHGFAWWTWQCNCCGTYQREAESGKLVYS